jgi:hypothetical protein
MEYIWEHRIPKESPPPPPFGRKKMGPRGCKLPPLIAWEGFSISNSVHHHLWPKLVAGAFV